MIIYYEKISCLGKLERYNEAIVAYNNLELKPNKSKYYTNRRFCYKKLIEITPGPPYGDNKRIFDRTEGWER